MRKTLVAVCVLMSAISHSRAAAQTTAVRIDRQPVIDGRIEESWIPGRLFDAFVQIEPDIDRHATLRTEVSFLYDRGTVFLAARMTQPKDTMRSSRSRRDSAVAANGDYVAFFLDPAASGNAAYFFLVNPSNAIQDGILDASGARTTQWDGRFASAVQVDEEGWSVEIAVPLDALDFQSRPVQQWGILCERYYAQEKRRFVSRLVDENRPFEIASFHRLLDLRDLERAKRHAVTPYAFAAATSHADSVTSRAETGVDL